MAAGKADTISLNEIIAAANRDTIKGLEIARDILQVGADETAAATVANTAPSNSVVSATAAAHTLADVDFTSLHLRQIQTLICLLQLMVRSC